MAIVYRTSPYGELSKYREQARAKAFLDPTLTPQLSLIDQQNTVLDSQAQQIIQANQTELNALQDKAYFANRAQREQNALNGIIGNIAYNRASQNLQNELNTELNKVLNQSTSGVLALAGQQSALHKQEILLLQNKILNEYVDDGIKNKKNFIQRDYDREYWYQLNEAGLGALKGAGFALGLGLTGKGLVGGAKSVISGLAQGGLFGAGLGFGINELVSGFGGDSNLTAALAAGAPIGGAIGGLLTSGALGQKAAQEAAKAAAKAAGKEVVEKTAQQAAKSFFKVSFKDWGKGVLGTPQGWGGRVLARNTYSATASKLFNSRIALARGVGTVSSRFGAAIGRINPWTLAFIAVAAAGGALFYGLTARNTNFFKVDYEGFKQSDFASQLLQFGANIEQIKDITKDKKTVYGEIK